MSEMEESVERKTKKQAPRPAMRTESEESGP